MWKRVISSLLGVSLIMCTFIGLETLQKKLPKQEPIILETVGDMPLKDRGPKQEFTVEAKGAVLIDAETGQVLFQQDAHKELPIASVTKVMTMLLVMEDVKNGKISLDDMVTISEKAASMGGSQMYMEPGEKHTVAQLMEGVAMASANDGCVALAEYTAGSEEIFVEKMNSRAKELGLEDTHFVNTNGLPAAEHFSSAYDVAVMSRELYSHEQTHQWFTKWQSTIKVGLPGKEKDFGLTNTNKLIRHYPGCNGIKTGFTQEAGYCLSASAERDGTHLIAVALGCETSKLRNAQVAKLFDYGFANYRTEVITEKGERITTLEVQRGNPVILNAVAETKIAVLTSKGEKDIIKTEIKIKDKIRLPLKAGESVGTLYVKKGGETVAQCELLAETEVKKASMPELIKRMFEKRGN